MPAPLNGHPLDAPAAPNPKPDIAQALYEAYWTEGDTPYADLDQGSKDDLLEYVGVALSLHVAWLAEHGFKVIPPGATPVPKTDDEALAMVAAAKGYFDAKRRKGGLMNGAVGRKLIVPGGRMQ